MLVIAIIIGISMGSSNIKIQDVINSLIRPETVDQTTYAIIWRIRFPRTLMAALVGSALSLGGLVFQAVLRNPLAEPYILGISGGAAIGAILGILLKLSRFPGICSFAFIGSMGTLLMVFIISSGKSMLKKDALLLSGVMLNAFCSAVIIFLISLSHDSSMHNIIFWLMGDLSISSLYHVGILAAMLLPCFIILFYLSHAMNLLLIGKEIAMTMGLNVNFIIVVLLIISSFMVSSTVSYCGLLGFVGLVMPHLLRLMISHDHRILVPACVLGGGAYMILCDTLARVLPANGEMPVGVITAMVGAPLFIFLLKRSKK
ncbi:MAG: iron ABC transporter permease [Desulfobacterales bacterium]|nr:iron ABC transporter permease [Desulfobacterales bacterium]